MKKKIAVGVTLIAFLLAGSGLWYTRPQTFWDATGMDRDKITGASGYAIEGSVTDGTASQQIWMLDNLTPGQEVKSGDTVVMISNNVTMLVTITVDDRNISFIKPGNYVDLDWNGQEDTTYRASLQNLLPPSSSHSADHVTAMAAFALGDELVTVHADYPGKVWISPAHSRTLAFSISARELNETLADFIQQHGAAGDP